MKVLEKYLNNLRFADDIALVAKNCEEMTKMTKELNTACNDFGL